MTSARSEKTSTKPREPRLSPELSEFLSVLTALEQQALLPASPAPSSR